jgi:hypothetical protein
MPIAYAVAADHPERLDRLVVSEAPLPGHLSLFGAEFSATAGTKTLPEDAVTTVAPDATLAAP